MTLGQPRVRSSFGGIVFALLSTAFATPGLKAQHEAPDEPAKAPLQGHASKRATPHNNSASRAATHDPRPELPPLIAWHYIKIGNAAFVATREQVARLARHAHPSQAQGLHAAHSPHGPRAHETPTEEASTHEDSTHGTAPHAGDAHDTGSHESETPHHEITTHKDHKAPATAAEQEHAAMPKRPAGAGKYVCAVITCADMPFDVADLLGLERKDVLVMRLPALLVRAEAVALLDRVIQKERLSLVLILSHNSCEALRERARQPHTAPDALDRRIAALQARAPRRNVFDAVVRRQREQLVSSSNQMRRLLARDRLRILPGVIDARTGQIAWKNRRAEAMPMSPVK